MTVTTTSNQVTYVGNDVTTEWDFTFPILQASHVVVSVYDSVTEAVAVISSSAYSVAFNEDNTGTVTYPLSGTPLTTTDSLIIQRVVPYTQTLDINNQDGFFPELVEDQLDLIVMMIQQNETSAARVITAPIFDSDLISLELPVAADRASKYLFFDSSGNVGVTGTAPSVQYQGAFTTANEPTTRLGGSALQAGDLYFNTSTTRLKVYDGAAWQTGVDASTTIDINGMTALADPVASGDFFPLYDLSETANRKASPQQVWNYLGTLTTETTIDLANDFLALYDASGSATDKVTPQVLFNQLGALTTLAGGSLDAAADWIPVYDQDGAAIKKLQVDDLPSGGLNTVAAQTTSGAATYDWAIPAGAKKIWMTGSAVSGSGTANFNTRIGTASTVETTGYVSTADSEGSGAATATASMVIANSIVAASTYYFNVELTHMGSNVWVQTSKLAGVGTASVQLGGGGITLGGELDILQLRVASGTFDGGTVIVHWI